MKKKIFLFALVLFSYLAAVGQDSFYYYKGGRVTLKENSNKIVAIIPASVPNSLLIRGFELESTIPDTENRICVYKFNPSSYNVAQAKNVVARSVLGSVGIYSCYTNAAGKDLIPTGYIYVMLKSSADVSLLTNVANMYSLDIVRQNTFMPLWYVLRVTGNTGVSSVDLANDMYESGQFASVSPELSFNALEISYDAEVGNQWGLYNSQYEGFDISISAAWSYATGRGVTIAIIDQGIDLNHQDLAANIHSRSFDSFTGTSPSKVYGDHGTHCAGIAAAVRNNGIQVAGVAPDAKLMSVSNILNNATIEKLADGINWAWKNGADVISCSWWCEQNDILEMAIDSAITKGRKGKGCVFVKSAGNTFDAISYPGNYRKEVLAVANMTRDGSLSASSAFGDNMFVTAPGTAIWSTVPGNATDSMSGTSMAAPHVAGLAALILERNPQLTAEKVREVIARNAKKVGKYGYNKTKQYGSWNEHYGYGLIDAYNAVLNTPRY